MARMEDVSNSWASSISIMAVRLIDKSIWSIIQRLIWAAAVYHMWQERNLRLFQKKKRAMEELFCHMDEVVKLRSLELKIKCSTEIQK